MSDYLKGLDARGAWADFERRIQWGVDESDLKHSTTCCNCAYNLVLPDPREERACKLSVSLLGHHPGVGFFCGFWKHRED